MSVQLFDSETSESSFSSYYCPKPKKRRIYDDSSRSIQLFDSEGSSISTINSPQSKEQCVNANDASQKDIQIDENDHIACYPGLIINGKYKIIRSLGEGAFGRVIEVQNLNTNKIMALKTIKNRKHFKQAANHEITVLERISKADPQDTSLCIKMLDWFDIHGHICIGFEVLGLSVHQFLQKNHYQPFPLDQVRHIGHQLCQSVNFLHRNGITHTDLKPDNILFVDTNRNDLTNGNRTLQRTDIRLIDFGNAVLGQQLRKNNITTRFYRAPEVILKSGWAHHSDVWSIGCILFELYVGEMLFTIPDNSHHHLATMEKILGQFPEHMTDENKENYFIEGKVNFNWSNVIVDMRNYYKPINEYMSTKSSDEIQLFDLITKMLVYEPSKRIELDEALKHSFFDKLANI